MPMRRAGTTAFALILGWSSSLDLFAVEGQAAEPGPTVIAVEPPSDSNAVGLGIVPILYFSEALDPATVVGPHIRLEPAWGGPAVSVRLAYEPGTTRVELEPETDLKPGIPYRIVVTTEVKSLSGVPLAKPFKSSFETGFVPWHAAAYALGNVDQHLTGSEGFFTGASAPYVEGFAIRTSWVEYEPADGEFDWTTLDADLEVLRTLGKKASLTLFPFKTVRTSPTEFDFIPHPGWVAPAQVFYGKFKSAPIKAFPVPWDAAVLEKWLRFVRALARHFYEEKPHLLPTISYVNGAGDACTLNWGIHPQILKIYADPQGQTPTTWQALGYDSQKMIETIRASMDVFASAFPDKVQWFSAGDIVMNPSLDPHPAYVAEECLTYGLARYPDRLGIWREDLTAKRASKAPPPSGGIWELISRHRPKAGAQMIAPAAGTTMSDPGTAKHVALRTAIEIGSSGDDGMQDGTPDGYYLMPYQEIYQLDVQDADPLMTQVFADAKNLLRWKSDATAPAVPGGLGASQTATGLSLAWNPCSDRWDRTTAYTDGLQPSPRFLPGSLGSVGYRVYKDGQLVGVTPDSSFAEGGLIPGAEHVYEVAAFDAHGNASARSAPLRVIVNREPTISSAPSAQPNPVMLP